MGDYRTTTGEPLPPPTRVRRARLWRGLLVGLFLVGGILALGLIYRIERYVPAVGYVTTEEFAEVRAPISGTVAEIVVDTGVQVSQGDVLIRLDAAQQVAALEEAKAQLSRIQAEAARRQIEIAERKRTLAEETAVAQLRLTNAVRKLERTRELVAKGLAAGSQLEDLELQRDLSEADVNSLRNRDLSLFERELEGVGQEVKAHEDGVRLAELRVASREVRAPISGQVLRYDFVLGEMVQPDRVLMELFGGARQVLRLKVAERYAAMVAAGQRYTARLASYRGTNEVIFTGAVENLRNVIEGDGERTYRVAYCSFEANGRPVPPGTSAEARIYYGDSTFWHYLLGLP
ncbi:MAG: multidrug resistance protein MdtN [Lentisphaerae bacterium ADurb.BinA184]|nr:MAG: multidrug resistance protein MdtN [Lentisphaerae bacterium ADurb.BinA184]